MISPHPITPPSFRLTLQTYDKRETCRVDAHVLSGMLAAVILS